MNNANPPDVAAGLATLAREQNVRILFAAESGSRAWGFASTDSDYDGRFLYAPEWRWYFSVFPPRDVIEAALPGDLDLAGWELRKALGLFAKGNVPIYEWLGSPIVYLEAPGFADELRALIPALFNPAAAIFHYLGVARATLEGHLQNPEVRIKKVFYLLRPLLAARWIAERRTMPPTPFAELVEAYAATAEEKSWIKALLAQKAKAGEAKTIALDPGARQAWADEIEHLNALGPTLAIQREVPYRELDALLLRWAGLPERGASLF